MSDPIPDAARPSDAADPPDSPARLNALARAVVVSQDRAAFGALFEAVGPRLKAWLVRSGSAPEIADEIVQDAFVAFWRKAAQFDPARADVAGWLYAIARNLRIDRLRHPGNHCEALDDAITDHLADDAPAIDEDLDARQRERRLREALASLDDTDRQYLVWSFFDEKSHATIAREQDLPLGTVKTRIRRAATRLRALLEGLQP